MGLTLLTNDDTQIIRVVEALYNQRPGSTLLGNFQSVVTADGIDSFANQMLANDAALTALSDADLAAAITTNLGLTGDVATAGNAYLAGQFAANPAARGKVILDAMNALATLEGDATFGAAAATFNADIVASLEYSSVAANTGVVASDAAADATAAAAAATAAAALAAVGKVFSLTTATDNLSPSSTTAANVTTAGDDTIYGTTTGQFASDIIDAGAGADTIIASITSNDQTVQPISVTGVETITITTTAVDAKTLTVNATGITGADIINIKGAGSDSALNSDELITVSNIDKATTLGIIGGTASTGTTASEITATWLSALAADTQKIDINTLGKVGTLTLATATTAEITATGTGTTGANTIGTLAATAVTALNLKGTGDLTISASDLGVAPTINATAAGKISFAGESGVAFTYNGAGNDSDQTVTAAGTGADSITTGGGDDTITTGAAAAETVIAGAGDDTVIIGATTAITVDDSIDGGAGTDKLSTSDGTLNATDKTALALGVSNFETIVTSNTTEVTVDFNALSAYDTVEVSGAMVSATTTANGDTAAANSVGVTMENADTLVISNSRVADEGGDGSTSASSTGGAGGDGINVAVKLDNGSNTTNLVMVGNADITGGAGQDGAATSTAGDGGDALDAVTTELLNIDIQSVTAQNTAGTLVHGDGDTVTFANGAAGATNAANGSIAGTAGSDVIVGTNATITLTNSFGTVAATGLAAEIHGSVNLGTVVGSNVTINGTAFLGNITATTGTGNETLNGGAGIDTLNGGAGVDTITGGAGNDIITGAAGGDALSGGAGRDAFVLAVQTESALAAYDTISDFGKVTTAVTASEVNSMTNQATFVAAATAKGGADVDYIDFKNTVNLEAAEAVDISALAGVTTGTATLTAKGIITLSGADAGVIDTLAEWVDAAEIVLDTANDIAAFEFNGNTYVLQNTTTDANDQLIELTGVTGVTGLVELGTASTAVVGDVFIL
jgi:hypothetical protein